MLRIGLIVVFLALLGMVVLGIGMGMGFVQFDSHGLSLVHKDAADKPADGQQVVSADDLLKQKGVTYTEPAPAVEAPKPAAPQIAKASTPAVPTPAKPAPAVAVKPVAPAPAKAPATQTPAQPVVASLHQPANASAGVIRIAAGSKTPLTDPDGHVWEASNGFDSGEIKAAEKPPVQNSRFPALYAGEWWNAKTWHHAVPNGNYTVMLHFAEMCNAITGPGVRQFNMDVQGQPLHHIDVLKEADGYSKELIRTVNVAVTDGNLTIHFTKVGEHFPIICGIEVVPAGPGGQNIVAHVDEHPLFALRIDAGSPNAVHDPHGNTWEADSGFDGGEVVDRGPVAIANTDFPDLYRTERFNMTGWHKAVPNGNYTVNLYFAETWHGIGDTPDTHPRIFDLKVQGIELKGINVFKETGGLRRALVKTFHVTVKDGNLAIGFTRTKDDAPEINGIEVIADRPTVRIDAGSPTAVRDPRGNTWEAESGFDGGQTVDRGPVAVANTDFPDIYRTERWAMTGWSRHVPNGKYAINLHFAETSEHINDGHPRIFSVIVQGNELRDLNVAKEAGGNNKALVKSFHVTVADGRLSILFQHGKTDDGPEINGIEIVPE
ncbi:MAG TPA: malectin domain-containing carbohydrate-binding protein [Tepidisphaeraceae bacterium]|nr:malectin domain-containing carbohydrate-binding protein [Tepidisphaeraceae bacterium]